MGDRIYLNRIPQRLVKEISSNGTTSFLQIITPSGIPIIPGIPAVTANSILLFNVHRLNFLLKFGIRQDAIRIVNGVLLLFIRHYFFISYCYRTIFCTNSAMHNPFAAKRYNIILSHYQYRLLSGKHATHEDGCLI